MQSRLIIVTALALAFATMTAQSASAAPMPQPSFHTKGLRGAPEWGLRTAFTLLFPTGGMPNSGSATAK